MKCLIVCTVMVACLAYFVQSTDYCSVECYGGEHVACNNDGKTHCSSDNSNVEIVEFNQTEIDYILQLHNDYRNAVANGSMERYDSASMMVKMVWNDELAKLAGLNTRNCSFGHDSCRNTDEFKTAGQNLAAVSAYNRDLTSFAAINQSISDLWFGEHVFANSSIINDFKTQTNTSEEYGHFTQLVNGNSTAVGCGATRYVYNSFHRFYFGCNYGRGNVVTATVYVAGETASGCTSTDSTYPALCEANDPKVDPNYLF